MGIAALILGVLGLIVAWIPFCGMVAFIPCLIGLGLGIADVVIKGRRGESKTMGIVGTVLNAVALVVVIIWTVIVASQAAAVANDPEFRETFQKEFQKAIEEAEKKAQEQGGTVTVTTEDVVVEAPAQQK
ncbi:MAG: hypothetical protein HPZ91_14340 [Lentisphaeria bacterium]|nr:hypothetical protein [Lentisphaeria bacterium]